MNGNFEIGIASPPDREALVAELWWHGPGPLAGMIEKLLQALERGAWRLGLPERVATPQEGLDVSVDEDHRLARFCLGHVTVEVTEEASVCVLRAAIDQTIATQYAPLVQALTESIAGVTSHAP